MLQANDILFSQYKIIKTIGKGGMGQVYLAQDLQDGSQWAIKENLISKYASQLYDENDVLSRLHHPALPKTRGVHQWQGGTYMIMEYMSGETLDAMLKTQIRFPEATVLKWFREICDVLILLHSQEQPIVYRDLKPSNIIIDENNSVKIIDFGIAEQYSADSEMKSMGLTKGYAAPEQYNRRFKADVRTDIYALGVTMHYLLTGKNPVKPPYEFVPVRKLAKDVSPAMESIVKKCIQPNPDKRYLDAHALFHDLTHMDEVAARIRKVKLQRIVAAAGVLVILAAGFLTIESLARSKREKEVQTYTTILAQAAEAGTPADAEQLLLEATQLQPKEMAAYLAIAKLRMAEPTPDRFLDYIGTEVLGRFPDCYQNLDFLHLMASFYDTQAAYADARYYYEQICALAPGAAENWLDLSRCCLNLGDRAAALESIEKYHTVGGDQVIYEETLKKIS